MGKCHRSGAISDCIELRISHWSDKHLVKFYQWFSGEKTDVEIGDQFLFIKQKKRIILFNIKFWK